MNIRGAGIVILLLSTLVLPSCKTEEERAAQYLESAREFISQGDTDRASVELRNLLSADNFSFEGRKLYADLVYEAGKFEEAYGQYLRLVEQYPDTLEVRRRLAEMALRSGNWDELERHTAAAMRLDPDGPQSQALQIAADYRHARIVHDAAAAAAATEAARQQLAETPDSIAALFVLIDGLYNGASPTEALPYIARLLEIEPDLFAVHVTRVRILEEAGRGEEIGAALRQAFAQFPGNAELPKMLVRWHLSRGDSAGAEAFLRAQAGPDDAEPEGHLAVVRLLGAHRGAGAAIAELSRLERANAGSGRAQVYALRRALLEMAGGDIASARATFERLVREAQDGDVRNEARAALARLALREPAPAEAQRLVAAILEEDPSNVAGLVLRGTAAITAGDGATAILDLRRALDQDPRNPDTLLLLAEAQKLQGNAELAEQRLAQAVEVTGSRPREAIVYAQFQIGRGNSGAAQSALADAFRAHRDLGVAQLLGQIYLEQGDASGGARLVRSLAELRTAEAEDLARRLQAALLFSENKVEESLQLLQNTLPEDDAAALRAGLQMLRMQILTKRFDAASELLQQLRQRVPGAPGFDVLEASVLAAQGREAEATALLRDALAAQPSRVVVAQRLYGLLSRQGAEAEARQVLATALNASPEARALRLLHAMDLDGQGQHDHALAAYAALHEEAPADLVVANNYANALALYRDDSESLDKARAITRRLIGSREPHYLDTIGLVLLQTGEPEAALPNLQAAARSLPDNPVVAFNLGLALAELGQKQAAQRELRRGMGLAGSRQDLPQYERARHTLRGLES